MGKTLDEVLEAVNAESTVADSVLTLIGGLESQLKAALADASLSEEDQAKVDAIFAAINSEKDKLSAAIVANTPIAPAQPGV